ncbi:MBOAT family protein [Clostridiaceae bacterium Marseille-Q3526]|nr:MBOAT family protein [Clostridiaceae bacterium Marseille-Q3526]
MVFSSILFIFYFLPLTLLLYYAGPSRLRNLVLLVMSLAFYSWGEPVYISIMLFSTVFDYGNGIAIEKCLSSGRKRAARAVLLLSVAGNLGILGFFKYSNFFIETVNAAGGTDFPLLELSLPIGISFYTFQTMSYTIDVYLGQARAQKNLVQFGAYVAMFPQLVAGPIVKYKDISGQLADRNVTAERFSYGISRFITGLSKKVLLANNIGMVWEQISGGNLAGLSAAEAWIGAAAFSFQIYFDFSGYSDMAIGLGELFGFHFQENFNHPYRSKSMTEFWRRWHISLGTWFREYVYIPLGGSRKGMKRQLLNLLIVWCLTGLWHGASWNFLVWGLYFGVFLTAEKLFLLRRLEALPGWVSHAYCLIFVAVSWVIFAFDSMADVCTYVKSMFGLGSGGWIEEAALYYGETWGVFFVVCALCSLGIFKMKRAFLPVLFAASICFLAGGTYNPFLYFRF